MSDLIAFYKEQYMRVLEQTLEHLWLSLLSVLLAALIAVPLGIWIAKRKIWSRLVLNFTGILQTIPSIALLGFLIPILGIGVKPAIFALFLYSLLPIVRNVYTGITEIDDAVTDSAAGMGMSFWQILFKVEIPLALPTIFAGIRTATVINVGVATLAAYIGAGGLGEFIFGGIALNNSTMIMAGAIPAALLAVILDSIFSRLQKSNLSRLRNLSFIVLLFIGMPLALGSFNKMTKTSLLAGFEPEFVGRSDGLPSLKKTYDLGISHIVMGSALMYEAIHQNRVDVISGYSTDARIKSYDLKALDDDLNNFPPYHAALLARQDLFSRYPKLKETIALLDNVIDDSTMTYLNYLVDHEKRSVRDVARDFLQQHSLYKPTDELNPVLTIGSKVFTEQYILSEIYKLLIEGHAGLGVETKNGLGGTKICFSALLEGEIDMYPEYSGTALQVILNREQKDFGYGDTLFNKIKAELHSEYDLYYGQPLGFNNTYALMMRSEHAQSLDIGNISELTAYLKER